MLEITFYNLKLVLIEYHCEIEDGRILGNNLPWILSAWRFWDQGRDPYGRWQFKKKLKCIWVASKMVLTINSCQEHIIETLTFKK